MPYERLKGLEVNELSNSRLRTGIIFSECFFLHRTGRNHPESPARLRAIMRGINRLNLLKNKRCVLVKPRIAKLDELEMVHSPRYIRAVRKFCSSGGGILDEETGTSVSPESYTVARLAAGGAIRAVDMVMEGKIRNAFVISRPPGHHASHASASGFCIFNNIALAAKRLIDRFSLSRILILDIDVHHGNGTQEIFYNTDEVLYISLHEDPSEFPRSGFIDEVGNKKGKGYTVNIPLPFGTSDPAYWKALKFIVIPIALCYKPEFILISAGFDGYFRDPIGELLLSASLYLKVFQVVIDLARRLSGDRLVAILEGGYCPSFLKSIIPAILFRMMGIEAMVRDRRPRFSITVHKIAEKIIRRVKETQSRFWNLTL
ncbi:histone deacetylase [Candidatus Bathyarchaeota archaeon]|nr:MAG: histone deacetylase [Candidatus Bathyarchaeota archaeon]